VPVSQGRQHRSRRTLEKLLDTAEELLAEKTFEEIRIQEIVERAGSSIGSFYARFSDKEALRLCLIGRYHDDMIETARDALAPERWEGVEFAERANAFVRGVVELCRRRYGLMRMRYLHHITHPESVDDNEMEKMREFVGRVEEFFRPVLPVTAKGDHAPDLSFALRIVDTVIANTILLDLEKNTSYRDIDDESLIEETTAAFVGYLSA